MALLLSQTSGALVLDGVNDVTLSDQLIISRTWLMPSVRVGIAERQFFPPTPGWNILYWLHKPSNLK